MNNLKCQERVNEQNSFGTPTWNWMSEYDSHQFHGFSEKKIKRSKVPIVFFTQEIKISSISTITGGNKQKQIRRIESSAEFYGCCGFLNVAQMRILCTKSYRALPFVFQRHNSKIKLNNSLNISELYLSWLSEDHVSFNTVHSDKVTKDLFQEECFLFMLWTSESEHKSLASKVGQIPLPKIIPTPIQKLTHQQKEGNGAQPT